jgi:hypothetical protein
MYLQKQVATKYGIDGDCWGIGDTSTKLAEDNQILVAGNLSLWLNVDAKNQGKYILDNIQFSCLIPANTSALTMQESLFEKIIEQGVHSGSLMGEVDFSDAVIITG